MMKTWDFDAVDYDGVSLRDPEVEPIFADSGWDYYPVCEVYGHRHDYVSLTAYGRKNEGIDEGTDKED